MDESDRGVLKCHDIPRFSVVVPSNRDPAHIRACLAGLDAQDYPRDGFEVVVVDDGSPARLAPVVAAFDALRARTHTQLRSGPAAARNRGAKVATARFLAFIDDDCVPAADWLTQLADVLVGQPDALVGGAVQNVLDDRYAEASQSLVQFLAEAWNENSSHRFFTSNNLAVSRAAFEEIGGFDETFSAPGGEDRELCERWHASGHPLVAAPRAVVRHAHAMTFRRFVHQHRNYGRGAYTVRSRRSSSDSAGILPEAPGFYLRLVSAPFGRLPFGKALEQASLLAISQVATAIGYTDECRRGQGESPRSGQRGETD